jgi:4-hydroxybenzoate polyprenyltransferase
MHTLFRSGRFYFWPIICANTVSMTWVLGQDLKRAAVFSLVISLLASFGFLLNDLWDRNIDRINRARHFEESSAGILLIATGVGLFLLIAALIISYRLGTLEFAAAASIGLALIAYSVLFRKLLLIPTILAAVLATSPLWSPLVLWAHNVSEWKWMFIASIIIMVAARETFMDARDHPGDVIGGRDTVATLFGKGIAKLVATLLTVSGAVPFTIAIAQSTRGNPLAGRLGAVLVGSTILYLLVQPAIKILIDSKDERASIQRYVTRSRMAMALIPLLLLCWNR